MNVKIEKNENLLKFWKFILVSSFLLTDEFAECVIDDFELTVIDKEHCLAFNIEHGSLVLFERVGSLTSIRWEIIEDNAKAMDVLIGPEELRSK